MRRHFRGAAGEVTGSLHEVHAAGHRVLLLLRHVPGLSRGRTRNADSFPFEPAQLDALIISHAHIDHIGRVPLLVRRGFQGPIHAQDATADPIPIPIMLRDAALIAENAAERANRRRRNHEPAALPLYTREDVDDATREAVALRPAQQCRAGINIVFATPATSSVHASSARRWWRQRVKRWRASWVSGMALPRRWRGQGWCGMCRPAMQIKLPC